MYQLINRLPFFYGWTILFAAGSSMVVRNATASLTLAVFIFPMSEDLGWSRTLIAGAASLGGLVATVASPLVGWALDRYGARTILTVSVLILGLSTVSLAWATVPIAFYLAYGLGRVIFASPLNIGPSVVVSRWFVRRRGRATGILFLSHSLGMITFPLIAGLVIKYRGWEDAWAVLGVLVWILALGPVSMLVRQSPESVGLLPDGTNGRRQGSGGCCRRAELDTAGGRAHSDPVAAGDGHWVIVLTPVRHQYSPRGLFLGPRTGGGYLGGVIEFERGIHRGRQHLLGLVGGPSARPIHLRRGGVDDGGGAGPIPHG